MKILPVCAVAGTGLAESSTVAYDILSISTGGGSYASRLMASGSNHLT
jgi:hypothetical protein